MNTIEKIYLKLQDVYGCSSQELEWILKYQFENDLKLMIESTSFQNDDIEMDFLWAIYQEEMSHQKTAA
ncbi:hypothetical protein OAT67_01205 [Bacteriovoracaceae bacterium]|nr:hypothetical protein [Bacteriovoracaceae bacterium]|tara:strand:- start:154283 stop:154489 length:207 start_codon:yes stop_codon:yes gene_type:complete